MKQENSILFSPYSMGKLHLQNRIVMAPMTRSRAIGNIPNDMMAQYYSDRADAGLLVTEGTSPSANGLGYSRIPGLFTEQQVTGWRKVTDAVHAANGLIFVQIMHTGRIGHPDNLPAGAKLVAPSAIAAAGQIWTDNYQMQAHPVPEAIPTAGIPDVIAEYVHSAKLAIEAGFDGVEIHAANGYLPTQFLNPTSNKREDQYGGSYQNRNRFVLELAQAMAHAIGKEKVGIRISPFNKSGDLVPDEHEQAQYLALAAGLREIGVVYLHMLTFAMPKEMIAPMKEAFVGTVILNGGYTSHRAEDDLEAGVCDLVSFGSPFISNPDLVSRFKSGATLAVADRTTFFSPGEKGYNDYSRL